ncbi:MAG: SAM-dependent methyltransferase [Saprospiraceae bacterium]
MAQLILIPTPIAEDRHQNTAPDVIAATLPLKHFVVERVKTARRFLKAINPQVVIDDLSFFEIDKGFSEADLYLFLEIMKSGVPVGLMSEAGCPAVADPGHLAVAWCHKNKIDVRPLIGPSSIMMALMASGFNGQQFTFHGYLPNKKPELIQRLKNLDNLIEKQGATQIFIETPYRNGFVIETCLEALPPHRLLCVAAALDQDNEFIKTQTIAAWKKVDLAFLHKQPAVFLLGR